nr:unnamed protein product [Callosobruchus chinensis]
MYYLLYVVVNDEEGREECLESRFSISINLRDLVCHLRLASLPKVPPPPYRGLGGGRGGNAGGSGDTSIRSSGWSFFRQTPPPASSPDPTDTGSSSGGRVFDVHGACCDGYGLGGPPSVCAEGRSIHAVDRDRAAAGHARWHRSTATPPSGGRESTESTYALTPTVHPSGHIQQRDNVAPAFSK